MAAPTARKELAAARRQNAKSAVFETNTQTKGRTEAGSPPCSSRANGGDVPVKERRRDANLKQRFSRALFRLFFLETFDVVLLQIININRAGDKVNGRAIEKEPKILLF